MALKRGSLVPVAEVVSGLNGPVKAIRDASPQARHHFTRFDQVNQLVGASEADAEIGFMARMMALCSLPRSNPGNRHQYKRVNGPYKLIMSGHRGSQAPLWQSVALDSGLGLDRSGADRKPRACSREVAFRVHADPGGLQQRRQSIHPRP